MGDGVGDGAVVRTAVGSGVVAISAKKSRYFQQDKILQGFVGRRGWTAKEVAKFVLGWSDERYCDSQKRARDLSRSLRGRGAYLDEVGARICRKTQTEAMTYGLSDDGVAYLRGKGLLSGLDQVVEFSHVQAAVDVGVHVASGGLVAEGRVVDVAEPDVDAQIRIVAEKIEMFRAAGMDTKADEYVIELNKLTGGE